MTSYRALVTTRDGRSDWRQVEASCEEGALLQLAADGQAVLDLREGAPGLWERLNQPVRIRRVLGASDQALILVQLATLVGAGLPVDRSLDLLRDQAVRPAQRTMLSEALLRVRGGSGLAAALDSPGLFPAYVTGVLRAAEQSGRLGEALASLAERMSQAVATRRQLVTALTYPAAVLGATLIALVLVLTVVVPQFEPIFAGQESRLPTLTKAVLWASKAVAAYGTTTAALTVLLALSAVMLARRAPAPSRLRPRIKWPGSGLRDQYLAGQFCSLFGTLLQNRIPAVRALHLAHDTIASRRWREFLATVERRVREGERLSQALARGDLVPATAIRLLEVGERTGRLADTALQAGHVLNAVARARIDRIVSLANPIAIIGLGGLVALLVAGVMLGIFALGDFAG